MKKFLALYLCPQTVIEEWMQKPEDIRKPEEEKMQQEWNAWTQKVGGALLETAGAGSTKRVSKTGVQDVKNDVMMYSMVEAESPEAAAKLFENHPHLAIPGATIEIMPANVLPGM